MTKKKKFYKESQLTALIAKGKVGKFYVTENVYLQILSKKKTPKKIHNEKNIKAVVSSGTLGKYYVAANIYLEVLGEKKAVWKTRFLYRKKRVERKIATFGENNPYFMDYPGAVKKSIEFQRALSAGQNPLERDHASISTLDDLYLAFIESHTCEYKQEKRIYLQYIKPVLGEKLLADLTRGDLERLLKFIVMTGKKSIAARSLNFLRGLFNYANTHKLIIENVASHLTVVKHAGGYPPERQIFLTETEIETTFEVFKLYPNQAPVRSQIAMVFYLIFGFRKAELLSAQWSDFNFTKQEWVVKPTKMGEEQITIDVPDSVLPLFNELRTQSLGSKFMFPTAKKSKSGHLSESTLNTMLKKFFEEYRTKTVSFDNPLGNAGVRKFCIHDLRRTFTSSANDNEIAQEVTERCLNHKKRQRLRIYDLSNRQSQRKVVYEMMADIVLPLANLGPLLDNDENGIELQHAA